MPDYNRRFSEAGAGTNRHVLLCVCFARIFWTITAITHAAEVNGCNAVMIGKNWRDEIPPVRMGKSAMHQQQARISRLAPEQIMDGAAFDLDETLLEWSGHRAREPGWGWLSGICRCRRVFMNRRMNGTRRVGDRRSAAPSLAHYWRRGMFLEAHGCSTAFC